MKITLNGETVETDRCSLAELLVTFNYEEKTVATAINGEFVSVEDRQDTMLTENDAVDVIAPMAGG